LANKDAHLGCEIALDKTIGGLKTLYHWKCGH